MASKIDEIKAKAKERRQKAREYSRAWYYENKEKAKENGKAYRESHSEALKESKRAYVKKNRASLNIKQRAAYHLNKSGYKIRAALQRAKAKGWDFDLTAAWFDKRFDAGCELTGLPFKRGKLKNNVYSPSIDRIDNDRGYTKDNCRLILNCLNMFKGTGTDEEMLMIAKKLIERG